jgi:hypothetical protein
MAVQAGKAAAKGNLITVTLDGDTVQANFVPRRVSPQVSPSGVQSAGVRVAGRACPDGTDFRVWFKYGTESQLETPKGVRQEKRGVSRQTLAGLSCGTYLPLGRNLSDARRRNTQFQCLCC